MSRAGEKSRNLHCLGVSIGGVQLFGIAFHDRVARPGEY
jgi:hypothetical protein